MQIVMLVTIILIAIVGVLSHASFKKTSLISVLVLFSIYAFYHPMHPQALITLYGFLAIFPVVLIIVKKNLFNGFLFWFLLVMFKEFGKIPLPLLPDIKPERIIWFSLIVFLILEVLLKQRKKLLPVTGIELGMVCFCAYILLSMITAGTIYVEGRGLVLGTFLSGYAIPFTAFFLAKNLVDDKDKIKKIFMFFAVIGAYLGVTAIFEHFNLRSLVFPKFIVNPNYGTHWGRARGPFLNASINGAVMGMVLFMLFYLKSLKYKKFGKIFIVSSTAILLIALLFTYTRACWVAFFLAILIIPVFYVRWRATFIAGFLLLSVIAVIFFSQGLELTASKSASVSLKGEATLSERLLERTTQVNPIYSRLNIYMAIWHMFLERPIVGFGFNTFQEVSPKYYEVIEGIPYFGDGLSPHDTLSGILAELGLVGVGMILYIVIAILVASVRLYQKLKPDDIFGKRLLVAFFGVYIVYFVNIQFIEARFFVFANCVFYMFSGIIVGLKQRTNFNSVDYRRSVLGEEEA